MTVFRATLGAMLLAWGALAHAASCGGPHGTTAGTIATVNLDAQIARLPADDSRVDLLLERARFFADADALEQAIVLAERSAPTPVTLLRRARAHAAAHRFAEALEDLSEAETSGADTDAVRHARASVLVATGHADALLPALQAEADARTDYATQASLAVAYAETGRYADADARYARALAALETTSPFPYAWLAFARGVLWSEQAGDRPRGEAFYAQALACLPDFSAANIHMAEIEVARGALVPAQARLERVLIRSEEPEAMALLGAIQRRRGDGAQAAASIGTARQRFETLLAGEPLAYADHAAEFYLGVGHDPARAWQLARLNLDNRPTARALALARRAARANGLECGAGCAATGRAGHAPASVDNAPTR